MILPYCGVDEAGRGPVIGPLVVAAVYVYDDNALKALDVKDSKKLTPKKRELLYDKIIETAEHVKTVILSAEEIDNQRKLISLNEIELKMFVEAVTAIPTSEVFVDCPDVDEASFGRRMSSLIPSVKIISKHKADDTYPCVSAASIIAKVTRDRMLKEIEQQFGCPIGSGYPSDPVTISFIEKWIKEKGHPPEHTRTSWETVRRITSVSKTRKITDW